MKRRSLLVVLPVALSCSSWLIAQADAPPPAPVVFLKTPAIWLSYNQKTDFMQPYQHPEQWPRTSAAISVLQLPVPFTSRMSDRQLVSIFTFLRSHQVGFALEAPMLVPGTGNCGRGVEGFAENATIENLATRIKNLGGDVSFVSMDEPLYFGHFAAHYWQPNVVLCMASLKELADNAAGVIRQLRHVFPQVAVGEVEPVAGLQGVSTAEKMTVLQDWFAAYTESTGLKLAFLHFDVAWARSDRSSPLSTPAWAQELAASYALTRRNGIRNGVIYDGSPREQDGVSWEKDALWRADVTEHRLHLSFDDTLFESWTRLPDTILPEDAPGTMTNIVCRYLMSESFASGGKPALRSASRSCGSDQ